MAIGSLPLAYKEHIVVQPMTHRVLPLVLFFDGAQVARRISYKHNIGSETFDHGSSQAQPGQMRLPRPMQLACFWGTIQWFCAQLAPDKWPTQRRDARPWMCTHDSARSLDACNGYQGLPIVDQSQLGRAHPQLRLRILEHCRGAMSLLQGDARGHV